MAATKTPAVPPPPPVQIVLRLEYFDPVTQTRRRFPAGVPVHVVNATPAAPILVQSVTAANGLVVFPPYANGKRRIALRVDFVNEYIDLDTHGMVPASGVTLDDRRRLIRMPRWWDSRRQRNRFVDNRGGRFTGGILNPVQTQEGTVAAPWVIWVDLAWDKFWTSFVYYNTESRAEEGIHAGLRVEAYRSGTMTDANVIGAGTPLDDTGVAYVAVYDTSVSRNQVVLGFRSAADSYYLMTEANRRNRLRVVPTATYDAMTVTQRHAHYPVPAQWRSVQQWTRLGASQARTYEAVRGDTNTAIFNSKSIPISFHLDDFVLVSNSGTPIGWNVSNRFTLFDHLLAIRQSDPAHPYWTVNPTTPPGVLARNAFLADQFYFVAGQGHDRCTRVVAFRRTFHDLRNRRTTQGQILGARAAVANDHPQQRQRDLWQPNLSVNVGHFHLHYFHECATYNYNSVGERPLSHVLAHWSVRFVRRLGATVADEQQFRRVYLPEAERRLTGRHPGLTGVTSRKGYVIREHATTASVPPPPRWIKVRHFFEARDDSNVHCTATIGRNVPNTFRAFMGLDDAAFDVSDAGPIAGSTAGCAVDGETADRFTVAHEIGHALGLGDEYLEPMPMPLAAGASIWNDPVLPQFTQQYPGMHYSCDFDSGNVRGRGMMHDNTVLRTHVHWPCLRWVNRFGGVQSLAGGRHHEAFQVQAGGAATMVGNTLRYLLPTDRENPYHRADEGALSNGPHGRMRLWLYKIGQDEVAHCNVHQNLRDVDAILVIALNLHWAFVRQNGSQPWGPVADWSDRQQVMQRFETTVRDLTRYNAVYVADASTTLPGDTEPNHPNIRRCLLYFRPFYARAAAAGAHFRIRVRRSHLTNAANNAPDIMDPAFSGTTINIVEDPNPPSFTNMASLFRYTLGLPAVTTTTPPTPISTLAPAELTFLATWLTTSLARPYTINRIT